MILAAMLDGGEDELICDFAQYYHVLDWRALPLRTAAVLAAGLPQEARCKLRLQGVKAPLPTILLARLTDQMETWLWAHRDKSRGTGTTGPMSILDTLLAPADAGKTQIQVFRSGDEFRAAYESWIGGE